MPDSLMDLFYTTVGVILVMVLLTVLCCLLMKLSDLKLQSYIVKTAKDKGLRVDMETLKPKYSAQSLKSQANDNCTIMVADVGYIM